MIAVTGAGGFIGHHLVNWLVSLGNVVRGIDIKRPEFEPSLADEFILADLRDPMEAARALEGCDTVYHLAADMGGMGYISGRSDASVLINSMQINVAVILAVGRQPGARLFFSSSACVYPEARQAGEDSAPLREDEAFPADPDTRYGWEKLNAERILEAAFTLYGLERRVARFHNVYGPLGTWTGGKEKAPAALCRKVAEAKLAGRNSIEIWGDGEQRRSFLYIDDCIDGIVSLMASDYSGPVNIGSDRGVSINELAEIIMLAADWPVELVHVPGPQGVRSRNADIGLARERLKWAPTVTLESGLGATYRWIEEQVRSRSDPRES